jgi:hypothetical protein
MRAWFSGVWADVPARVAVLVAIAATVLEWFIDPNTDASEAIQALAMAAALATLWARGHIERHSALSDVALAVAVAGLVVEAGFHALADHPPLGVTLLFPAGLLLLIVAELRASGAASGSRAR